MKYLRVKNWEHFQHYKNRRAPWIKVYTEILDVNEHPTFTNLSDGAKLTLHHVRLAAGLTANEIPEVSLTRDRLNMKTPPRLTELVEAGFVEWVELAPNSLANCGDFEEKSDELASEALRARGSARSQGLSSSLLGKNQKHEKPRAREMVESFTVTPHLREWAALHAVGVDIDAETELWRDHFRSNGYQTRSGPLHDADAAWRNWMKREIKFSRQRHSGPRAVPDPTLTAGRTAAVTGVDELREWASARAASLMACERGGSWHHEDITESEFRAYWNWQQTERGGQIESDGVLNDYAAFLAAQKESA